mgnify:CR=1 FL=1
MRKALAVAATVIVLIGFWLVKGIPFVILKEATGISWSVTLAISLTFSAVILGRILRAYFRSGRSENLLMFVWKPMWRFARRLIPINIDSSVE